MSCIAERVNEGGTRIYELTFFDNVSSEPIVPKSITWSLVDSSGAPVNGRHAVNAVPAAITNIVLTGDDLRLMPTEASLTYGVRNLNVFVRYDSEYGENLTDSESFRIIVKRFSAL